MNCCIDCSCVLFNEGRTEGFKHHTVSRTIAVTTVTSSIFCKLKVLRKSQKKV
ncbi:hypothetical protein CY34DRAFT_799722 [Suillus luteus UH-Slu-Lm8-n1]|uniref:Uncharacterized protein n=1 Tax=Suillus luteus UH-Slu-Lm8-n1 TaxID=930992 RepID=A0A0D0BBE3_9AGAM|nr:hypothetical protein CY34DRAFT_799722 [Suillus luteus UH-Slu-Lm8-n1]